MESPSTDKKRLSQVQTQDLTESRLNDDFVFWLKKHGMNTLLAVLIAACAFLGYDYWRRKHVDQAASVCADLATATLPEAFEQIAKDHPEVPQAAMLALLQAGDLRLRQLQSGVLVAAQGTTPAVMLDDAGRKIAQDAADEDYAKAADLAKQVAGSNRAGVALVTLQALFGRAAIAESRGDMEAAKKLLAEAETTAGESWAPIAKLAKARIDGLVAIAEPLQLPRNADLPAPVSVTPVEPPAGSDALFDSVIKAQEAAKQQPAETPAVQPGAETPKSGG